MNRGATGVVCRVNVDVDVWEVDASEANGFKHLWRESLHNLVVDAGMDLIRDLLNSGGTGITHFGYGSSATAVAAGQTALVSQIARDTLTQKTATSLTLTCKYYLNTVTGNGNTIREMGLFTASVAGTMYARAVLTSEVVKDSSKAVTFTWTLTWAAA